MICIFLIILIFIYAKIFRAGRETARNRISDDGTVSKKAFLRNIKLAKSCLIVLCCTFFCFLPMAITSSMTNSFSKLDLVGRIMWSWSITLIFSSSTLNSVIFFWRNEILRNVAKTILRQTFLNFNWQSHGRQGPIIWQQIKHITNMAVSMVNDVIIQLRKDRVTV